MAEPSPPPPVVGDDAAAAADESGAWRIRADLAQGAMVAAGDVGGPDSDAAAEEEGREGGAEEASGSAFYRKSRHVFVLSSAGKPIYARHGEEDRLATLMPMISAIYDQFDDQGDPIQCIVSGNHRFVFQKREPLYLLAISDQRDPEGLLIQQMQYVYQCIVSLVTDSRLAALKRNLRMDISSHLEPHVITELYDCMERNPCFLLGGWNCLPMDLEVRKAVTQTLKDARVPDAIYSLLVALPTTSRQVVTLLEPRKSPLHATDLLLLCNFVAANTGRFQLSGTAFTHFCLPIKWKEGFHHVYVSFLLPELCLVLVSGNENCFDALHGCYATVHESLTQSGLLQELDEAIATPPFSIRRDLVPSGVVTHDLWHFMFKMTSRCQVAFPTFEGPLCGDDADADGDGGDGGEAGGDQRGSGGAAHGGGGGGGDAAAAGLFRAYQKLHTRMHNHGAAGGEAGGGGGSGGGGGGYGLLESPRLQPGKARACFYVTPVHSIFSYLTSVSTSSRALPTPALPTPATMPTVQCSVAIHCSALYYDSYGFRRH